MKTRFHRILANNVQHLLLLTFVSMLASSFANSQEPTQLRKIELTCIDDQVIHSATFQSNTQHVVSNRNGIFAAFVKTRNEDYSAQKWRLVRSVDGGRNFSLVTEGISATNAPVLESDDDGNIYLY
ncbi:MAG: hypothetical protein SFV81_01525 [Pirellulaceae bacterium]|nr:hypothetical protein [Pirellulaceae bacterium]